MTSHDDINRRSLALACELVRRVDADPQHEALAQARQRCERWLRTTPCTDLQEWSEILRNPWPTVRALLLDPSETGQRLRQSNPFCRVLTPQERWAIYRRTSRHDAQPT